MIRGRTKRRGHHGFGSVLLGLAVWVCGLAPTQADTELVNDGFGMAGTAVFQAGFDAGEIGAARFEPPGPCPCPVNRVRFLFGGPGTNGVVRTVTVRIWDDPGPSGPLDADPGGERFSRGYEITASDSAFQEVDLSGEGVFVNGPFRVGIEFDSAGLPSIARDDDGTLAADQNFLRSTALGWTQSGVLGLTGDWIIRASVGEGQTFLPNELKNDSWPPTLTAFFQAGFEVGEAAAVRLVPPGPCPCPVNGVSVLLGGGSGEVNLGLRIWDDSGGMDAPGALIYEDELTLTAGEAVINLIDLRAELITVDGPFRLGFVIQQTGLPSVARDADGITPDVNYLRANASGWAEASTFMIEGDWIMRAAVTNQDLETAVLGYDDWDAFELPAFQDGFAVGEIAAVRLVPDGQCPCEVLGVRLMFGGAPGMGSATLKIWDDAPDATPGSELYSVPIVLEANDLVLRDIDLSTTPVPVDGPFRVGIVFDAGGLPSVARDHDGTVPGRNFIFDDVSGWIDATAVPVPGDWIIRARVNDSIVVLRDSFE